MRCIGRCKASIHINPITKETMSSSKVVLVTGVSSGIGRASAVQFAQRGGKVFGLCPGRQEGRGHPRRRVRRDGRA
jgi:NAD(P)-dependent dehydrogenase (short-subunit alcohol dehydrogenase family)